MTHDAAEAAEREASRGSPTASGLRRPSVGVYLLAAACLATTVVFVAITPDDVDLGRPFGDWTFVIIMVMFGLAELSVFNFHFRRDSIAFALNEIPIAFAFTFLSPVVAPLARVPLSLLVMVFVRRNRPDKLAFNMSLHVFEVAFAGLVFHSLVGWWGAGSTGVVVAVAAALMIVTPCTSILIVIAISMFDGNTRERVVGELQATWWLYMVTSVLAAMTVALALFEPALTVLAALPILGMWYVLHAFGGVSQELRDLGTIHGFAGRVGDTLDVDAIGHVAVDSAMQMFRASGAVLVRFTDDGPVIHSAGSLSASPGGQLDVDAWRALTSDGGAVDLDRHQIVDLGMRAESSRPIVLMTSVDDGGESLGVLAVARDDLQHEQFDDGDRARLHNVGRQLSVALRRGILHERLEWEARHDALTELPGRTLFELYVTDVTQSSGTGVWAVMMLDLDRFKEVNDTLGHHAGDELLVEFSRRMSAILGPYDSLARLAGDEFAILCCRRSTRRDSRTGARLCPRRGQAGHARRPRDRGDGQRGRRRHPFSRPEGHRTDAPRRHRHVQREVATHRRRVLPGRDRPPDPGATVDAR